MLYKELQVVKNYPLLKPFLSNVTFILCGLGYVLPHWTRHCTVTVVLATCSLLEPSVSLCHLEMQLFFFCYCGDDGLKTKFT